MQESILPSMSVEDILACFSNGDRRYQRAAVDAALARREEIVPGLIKILETTLADPGKVIKDADNFSHLYAVMLLGHFREPRAHPVIMALAALPGKTSDNLFSDIVTEDFGTIFQRTCNGSFDAIKNLVNNPQANVYCRLAAMESMTYGVAAGMLPRREALDFLGGVLSAEIEKDASGTFITYVVSYLGYLCPKELMDKIEQAYDNDLIDDYEVDFDEIEIAIAQGWEGCLQDIKAEMTYHSLDDIHAAMESWGCFKQPVFRGSVPAKTPSPKPFPALLNQDPAASKAAKEKKAKRKAAEAARKKNR
jgi:hypothetical protein